MQLHERGNLNLKFMSSCGTRISVPVVANVNKTFTKLLLYSRDWKLLRLLDNLAASALLRAYTSVIYDCESIENVHHSFETEQ